MSGTQRIHFTDAALVRLLAAWRGQPDAGTPTGFIDQLGGWLRWTDAQPLFDALQNAVAVAPPAGDEDASAEAAAADCHGVHDLLTRTLVNDAPWLEAPRPQRRSVSAGWIAQAAVPQEPTFDFPTYRRHYMAQQQNMDDRITALRARLRRALQLRSPALARLAGLDVVMERLLGEPERRLLATMPAQLEQRFVQLGAGTAPAGDAAVTTPAAQAHWQLGFQQELEALLQAELALRWQPIQGLLAALRGV